MTAKEKTYKERENELRKGKKRFLERKIEEHEAEEEIKEFDPTSTHEDCLDPEIHWKGD